MMYAVWNYSLVVTVTHVTEEEDGICVFLVQWNSTLLLHFCVRKVWRGLKFIRGFKHS